MPAVPDGELVGDGDPVVVVDPPVHATATAAIASRARATRRDDMAAESIGDPRTGGFFVIRRRS
jgi:hypothetical protein